MAMTDVERVFVDTNVLLAATDRARGVHVESRVFLEESVRGKRRLFASGQIFREYLVVATRPVEQNGLGLPPADACANLSAFQSFIQILDENADTASHLHQLVSRLGLKGKKIHDANVVATMQSHGLTHLKTWNPADFTLFPQITIL